MKLPHAVLLGLTLISSTALAGARAQYEVGVGGGWQGTPVPRAGLLEGAGGVAWSWEETLLALRLEGLVMGGELMGLALGPGVVARHRFGEGTGWQPFVGAGASLLLGPLVVVDMASGATARLSLEGGWLKRDAEGRGVMVGLALRALVPLNVATAALVVGTAW